MEAVFYRIKMDLKANLKKFRLNDEVFERLKCIKSMIFLLNHSYVDPTSYARIIEHYQKLIKILSENIPKTKLLDDIIKLEDIVVEIFTKRLITIHSDLEYFLKIAKNNQYTLGSLLATVLYLKIDLNENELPSFEIL